MSCVQCLAPSMTFIMRLTPTPHTKGTAQQEKDEVNLLYYFIITQANMIKALQDEEPDQDAVFIF